MQRKPLFPQVAMALILWCLSGGHGAAEVRLSGTQDNVVLQVSDATIAEIVAAFRTTFDLEVTLKGTTARKFTGLYSGTVRQVLLRLLAGQDYILHATSVGMSIVLVGNSASDSAARPGLPPPPAPPPQNVAPPQAR